MPKMTESRVSHMHISIIYVLVQKLRDRSGEIIVQHNCQTLVPENDIFVVKRKEQFYIRHHFKIVRTLTRTNCNLVSTVTIICAV